MILWELVHAFWPTLPFFALPALLHPFEIKENVHVVQTCYTLELASYLLFGLLLATESMFLLIQKAQAVVVTAKPIINFD